MTRLWVRKLKGDSESDLEEETFKETFALLASV